MYLSRGMEVYTAPKGESMQFHGNTNWENLGHNPQTLLHNLYCLTEYIVLNSYQPNCLRPLRTTCSTVVSILLHSCIIKLLFYNKLGLKSAIQLLESTACCLYHSRFLFLQTCFTAVRQSLFTPLLGTYLLL